MQVRWLQVAGLAHCGDWWIGSSLVVDNWEAAREECGAVVWILQRRLQVYGGCSLC